VFENIGGGEILVILIFVFIFFGAKKYLVLLKGWERGFASSAKQRVIFKTKSEKGPSRSTTRARNSNRCPCYYAFHIILVCGDQLFSQELP
jgi:Sec-independent protein translocase protein TatA